MDSSTLCRQSPIRPKENVDEHRDGPRMTTGEGFAAREGGGPEVVEGDPQDVTLSFTPFIAGQHEEAEVMAMSDDEEEVEQGRIPRTRKPPVGMTPAEMRTHSLTHIPFPSCVSVLRRG